MYNSTKEFTIEPHCPWYQEQQVYGPPNVIWCEPEITLLHGHAIWHVISGMGMVALGLHLRGVLLKTKKTL